MPSIFRFTGRINLMIPPQELLKGHKFKVSGEAQFKGKA
jgi:hypothetical protein